jgi:hypothetical protein
MLALASFSRMTSALGTMGSPSKNGTIGDSTLSLSKRLKPLHSRRLVMLPNPNPNKPLAVSSVVKGTPRAWVLKRLRSMGKSPAQVKGYPAMSRLSLAQNQQPVPPVDVQGEAQKPLP